MSDIVKENEKQNSYQQLINNKFKIDLISEDIDKEEIPITDDIYFDCVNLDMETLRQMQKLNFWQFLIDKLPLHLRFGKSLSIDELLSFYPNYEEPLLPMNSSYYFFVEKIYKWLLKLVGISNKEISSNDEKKLQNIISLCMDKEIVLTNELYLTLIKFVRKNPDEQALTKSWQIFAEVCSCLVPSLDILPYIYNYLYNFINNHPQQNQREWARLCLKRLYYLDQNKFKKNYPPSYLEYKCTQIRKKLPLFIYLKNGMKTILYVEPYSTIDDVIKTVLKDFNIDQKKWKYLGIVESVVKQKALQERILDSNLMVGDILAGWELLNKSTADPIYYIKLYLTLVYFPIDNTDQMFFQREIFYELIYNIYFGKIFMERYSIIQVFSLALKIEFGDYVEKPGFLERQLSNYFHPFYAKYYANQKFYQDVQEYYVSLKGKSVEESFQEFFDLLGEGKQEFCHYFRVNFRNSNNPNFREMQQNLILAINKNYISLQEESSRENIIKINLEEVMNWGINKDIIVISYGDRFELIKIYFQSHNPYEIANILYSYCNAKAFQGGNLLQNHQELEEFIINSKSRRVNTFAFK